MAYDKVEYENLNVYPLAQRNSKSRIESILLDPDSTPPPIDKNQEKAVSELAERFVRARTANASIMLAFGAHLIKNGAASLLIRLMETGWVTHAATQGAGTIHDWELAFLGKTEEDVRAHVTKGIFGTWLETGKAINLAVQIGALDGMGYGQSLGAFIHKDGAELPELDMLIDDLHANLDDPLLPAKAELLATMRKFSLSGRVEMVHPYKQHSIFANAFRLNVPVTVHPGIGYDIIYNNTFANGAALGRGAHIDYQIFVNSMLNMSDGVFLSVGSAIMSPQVYEKALSFANNILLQNQKVVSGHYIFIDDLQQSVWDWSKGEPPKSSPDYYLRFLKSFHRMGGRVRYSAVDNRLLLHHLYHKLKTIQV